MTMAISGASGNPSSTTSRARPGAKRRSGGGRAASRSAGEDVRLIMNSMRRIVQILRIASRAAEKDVGLSGAQLWVLHKLAEGPVLSLNELAERTCTHQSSVSVVVYGLVERGLIARTQGRSDARQIELSLTPAARRLVQTAPGAAQDRLLIALDRMPASARRQLAQLLDRLVQETGAADVEKAPMFFEDAGAAERTARRTRQKSS